MLRRFINRFRFPGLGINGNVSCDVRGRFVYGTGCGLNTGAVISVPENTELHLGDQVYIGRHVELGSGNSIAIGDGSTFQDRCILLGDVAVGRYCLFSLNVFVSSGTHYPYLKPEWLIRDQDEHVRRTPALAAKHSRPVRIEDDCWIGVNSVIQPGVTIGKGSVIGANSVVNKDIPPYSIAVGAPAKIVKTRLDFLPPRGVDATKESDFPYFYSGFGVAAGERTAGGKFGGLLAGGEFRFALDTRAASRISLTARSTGEPCGLRFATQTAQLGSEFATATYGLDASKGGLLEFSAIGTCQTKWPVCISRVWVE